MSTTTTMVTSTSSMLAPNKNHHKTLRVLWCSNSNNPHDYNWFNNNNANKNIKPSSPTTKKQNQLSFRKSLNNIIRKKKTSGDVSSSSKKSTSKTNKSSNSRKPRELIATTKSATKTCAKTTTSQTDVVPDKRRINASIFRTSYLDECKENDNDNLLALKRANPIFEDDEDGIDRFYSRDDDTVSPSKRLKLLEIDDSTLDQLIEDEVSSEQKQVLDWNNQILGKSSFSVKQQQSKQQSIFRELSPSLPEERQERDSIRRDQTLSLERANPICDDEDYNNCKNKNSDNENTETTLLQISELDDITLDNIIENQAKQHLLQQERLHWNDQIESDDVATGDNNGSR